MTVTLEWIAGSESDGANSYLAEWGSYSAVNGVVSCATARPYTGAYSLRFYLPNPANSIGYAFVQHALAPTYQGRFGFYLYTDFLTANPANPSGLLQVGAASQLFGLQWAADTGNLELVVGGTVVATWAAQVTSAYHYISVDFKIDPSAGWVKVWNDGVLMLSFAGSTGSAQATTLMLGQYISSTTNTCFWDGNNLIDVDDFVLYDTTGETSAAPLPGDRFPWFEYTADGSTATFTPSSGSSHVAMLDEIPDDGDATYNYATAAGQIDTFSHAAFTLPAGYSVVAVIPTMIARKTDAALATAVAGYAGQGSSVAAGAALALATSYAAITASAIPADPATGQPWTAAGVNTAQFGYESAGAF
jgi:hypothetical protein